MDKKAKIWIEIAIRDYKTAVNNFKIKEFLFTSFLCHQSVEKALKALNIDKHGTAAKTHDLVFLAKNVNGPNEILDVCKQLNPIYMETRYPDTANLSYEYNNKDAKMFLKETKKVIAWIKKSLS